VCVCNADNWGVQCEYLNSINPDPCLTQQCNDRGTCVYAYAQIPDTDISRNFECICEGEYDPGTRCLTVRGFDFCSTNPCNSGSCVVNYTAMHNYECTCPTSESRDLHVIWM